jgi:nucleoside 2-deoxyribosyltransferase
MKRLFITASFQGGENKEEIEKLCELIKNSGWLDFCFIRDVEHYQKVFSNPSKLMQRALEEIQKSDALLIDMTDKPTGRAIEAGMAYALGKKVIVIYKSGTVIKDTTRGVAVETIEYENIEDIVDKLRLLS